MLVFVQLTLSHSAINHVLTTVKQSWWHPRKHLAAVRFSKQIVALTQVSGLQ